MVAAAAGAAEVMAAHTAVDKIIKIIPADQTGGLTTKLHNRFNSYKAKYEIIYEHF